MLTGTISSAKRPAALGCRGFALRVKGEFVLLGPADFPVLRDIFRRLAHVIAVEGVPKPVTNQRVDQSCIAQF